MTDTERAKPGQLVGRNLRRIRQDRGFSQRRLVGRMRELRFSWHQTTVQGVETGTRPVAVDELFALAVCLDTDIASLLDPVASGVHQVDVGLPFQLPAQVFRELVPISKEQGVNPRDVNSAEWYDDKPEVPGPYVFADLPAGEAAALQKVKELQGAIDELALLLQTERSLTEEMEHRRGQAEEP